MKKIFGLMAIAGLAMGSFTVSHAAPGGTCGDAGTPVDANCTTTVNHKTVSCELWVAPGTGTPVDGCNNPV